MDVDKNPATPTRYGVRGIPTLLLIKDGAVKDTLVGYAPKEAIERKINTVIG
jgi:thioredoxin 1